MAQVSAAPRFLRALPGLLKTRIARDGAWVVAGQVASAVAALAAIRLLTEILPPEAFGSLTLLIGVAALALGLTATPALQAVIRYYPDWARAGRLGELRGVSRTSILRGVAIAALAICVASLAAGPRFHIPRTTGLLIAALLVVDAVRSFEVSLLNAARRQAATALYSAADAWARPIAALVAVTIFGATAQAALAGYVVGAGLVVAVMHAAVRPEGRDAAPPDRERRDGELRAAIRRYALPLAPLAIFGWLSGMGDRYLIGGMLGLEQAGLYAAAYGLASRPFLMLTGVIELTMRPVLQNAIAAGDAERTRRIKRAWIVTSAASGVGGVVLFVLLKDVVAGLLLAPAYRSTAELMPWIAAGYALYGLATVYTRLCYAHDNTRAVLALVVLGSILSILIIVPAILVFGIIGAAASTPLYFGIQLALAKYFADISSPKALGVIARKATTTHPS